jgi:hypothetical protein
VEQWCKYRWHRFTPVALLYCSRLHSILAAELRFLRNRQFKRSERADWHDDIEGAARFVSERFALYVAVRAKHDRWFTGVPAVPDPDHSGLIRYLLSRRENFPLPLPPPLLYSYSSYDLAAGEAVTVEVKENWSTSGESTLVLSGNGNDFGWHDRARGVVKHLPTGEHYSLCGKKLRRLMRRAGTSGVLTTNDSLAILNEVCD